MKPVGFRAPYWRWSKNTLSILLERGYIYDSSLMNSEIPYVLKKEKKSFVILPVDWRLDDWPYLEYYRSLTPNELLEMWLDEIEYAKEKKGYLSITMHPQCIGKGSRIRILDKILNKATKEDAWIPKGEELANYILKN